MALDNTQNFADSALSSSVASGDTSMTVDDGSTFPSTPFRVTVWDSNTYSRPSEDPDAEIMLVTGVSTNTLTVERGKENTTAVSHSSGEAVENNLTADMIDQIETDISNAGGGGGQTLYDIVVDVNGNGDYTSISTALSNATSGDSIFVHSGTYSETTSVTVPDKCTLVGAGIDSTIIEVSGFDSATGNDPFFVTNMTIKNEENTPDDPFMSASIFMYDARLDFYGEAFTDAAVNECFHIIGESRFVNCEIIVDNGDGIYGFEDQNANYEVKFINNWIKVGKVELLTEPNSGSKTFTFIGNYVEHTGQNGEFRMAMELSASGRNYILKGNTFMTPEMGDYLVNASSGDVVISGNKFFSTASSGSEPPVKVSGANTAIITDNRITASGQASYAMVNIDAGGNGYVVSQNILGATSASSHVVDNGSGNIVNNNITQ